MSDSSGFPIPALSHNLALVLKLIVCMYMCVCMFVSVCVRVCAHHPCTYTNSPLHMYQVENDYYIQGLNSGHQTWWQAPLPTEPSCLPSNFRMDHNIQRSDSSHSGILTVSPSRSFDVNYIKTTA